MDEQTIEEKKNSILIPVIIVLIVVLSAGAVGYQTVYKKEIPVTHAQQTPTSTQKQLSYKNGTYSAVGDYTSPGGGEQLGVTVTLESGIIKNAQVKSKATRPNSVRFQGIFISNYKPLVIGKNINDVKLDKVSGSSLAPKGFNDALEKIKIEAKS